MAMLDTNSVSQVVWDILMRPHHRARWEAWSRPGLRGNDDDGAQTCIAWVVDDYRYDDAKELWKEPNSSPSSRSAVQRLFRQGARAVPGANDGMPLSRLTRSRILTDLVSAFDIGGQELDELRSAFRSPTATGTAHMGPSFHTWDVAQTDEDLRAVVQLSRRVIGGHAGFKTDNGDAPTASDIAPLREQVNRRPDAIELCIRNEIGGGSDTLVGYMLAYPVDAEAAAGLRSGAMTSAVDFMPDGIAQRVTDEAALYIGMVLGCDLPARASVMDRCITRWTTWASMHPESQIFAKRSTADGERWLEKYGFLPVADRDAIWVRSASAPVAQPRRRRLVAATV